MRRRWALRRTYSAVSALGTGAVLAAHDVSKHWTRAGAYRAMRRDMRLHDQSPAYRCLGWEITTEDRTNFAGTVQW